MKLIRTVLLPLFVFAAAITTNLSRAQPAGFAVTQRGADWRVLSKATVEHGTNRVHQYTELATGLNYQDSYGQWTESKEQIAILPTGGASATQGRHKVFFPSDIYNGVLEVVTPDGRHLRSRPLGVSYDDGSNTVFIATLKHAQGYLTSSNTVTYRDAFTGFKADLVCQYRRGGFECDLVFRQQPPTPDAYNLDPASSTLQMVTEFFNTQDPQEVPAAYDEWYGLQDSTLKFGKLTMTQGKAFAVKTTNASPSTLNSQLASAPVYKRWLKLDGRKFLIEELPVLDIADDLDALPLTASINPKTPDPKSKTLLASGKHAFPPAHEFISDTNQILIAAIDLNHEPGVVLDYNTVDSGQTDFTFHSGTTYFISDWVSLSGTTTLEGGAVIKYAPPYNTSAGISLGGDGADPVIICNTGSNNPAIFTSMDDDSVGDIITHSSGIPEGWYGQASLVFQTDNNVRLHDVRFYNQSYAIEGGGGLIEIENAQFIKCWEVFSASQVYCTLRNVLVAADGYGGMVMDCREGTLCAENVTFYGVHSLTPLTEDGLTIENVTVCLTNCLGVALANNPDSFSGVANEFPNSAAGVFQTAANANYYLAIFSPYRNAGTTNIDPDLLAEIQTMTTYAPQNGGWPDTNGTDLGYHYSVNEDSDYDGLPDWWEWTHFGNYTHTGTELDGIGNTLLYDYQNQIDPNPAEVQFSSITATNNYFNTSSAPVQLQVTGVPYYIAVLVDDTNFADAVWDSYSTSNVTVNLGATEGWHEFWIGLRGQADDVSAAQWQWRRLKLDTTPPVLVVTNPIIASGAATVSVPLVQIKGYCPEELASLSYDLSNAVAVITNLDGGVTGQFYSPDTLEFTTNYFECTDVPLTNGLNRITLHATDRAGNTSTRNFSVTVDYSNATNPVVRLTWPTDGMPICQGNFTLRGVVDDPTATVVAAITDTNGITSVVSGQVERTGVLWVENLPLAEGTNYLTLWVTNAAGYSSETNISVVKNDMTLALTSISGDLWNPTVGVSGVVSDPTAAVWVNGVQGTNNGDGTWNATNVPVSTGGVASFDLTANAAGGGASVGNTQTNKPDEIIIVAVAFNLADVILYDDGSTYDEHWNMPWTRNQVFDGHYNKYPSWEGATLVHYHLPADLSAGTGTEVTTHPDGTMTTSAYDPHGIPAWGADSFIDVNSPWWAGAGVGGKVRQTGKTQVHLLTGGKSGSQRQNLFQLTCPVHAYDPLPSWWNFSAEHYVPPQNITLGTVGKLGSDGNRWKMLRDDDDVDITPYIPGENYYTFMPGKQKYTLAISASSATSGAELDPDTKVDGADFWISEKVNLTQSFSPTLSENPVVFTNLWTLDGDYVNDSVQPYTTGSLDYFVNSSKLTNSDTYAWWWKASTSGSQLNISLTDGLTFANGQSVTISASGLIDIYKPKADIIATKPGTVAADGDYLLNLTYMNPNNPDASGLPVYLHFGGTVVSSYPLSIPGVKFEFSHNSVDVADANLKFLRTGTVHREQLTLDGTNYITDSKGLDTNPQIYGNHSEDSPAVSAAGCVTVSANDQFTEYLIFKHDGDSIDVPLQSVDWSWGGSASVNNGWQIVSPHSNLAPVNESPDFPKWTNSIHLQWTSHQP